MCRILSIGGTFPTSNWKALASNWVVLIFCYLNLLAQFFHSCCPIRVAVLLIEFNIAVYMKSMKKKRQILGSSKIGHSFENEQLLSLIRCSIIENRSFIFGEYTSNCSSFKLVLLIKVQEMYNNLKYKNAFKRVVMRNFLSKFHFLI